MLIIREWLIPSLPLSTGRHNVLPRFVCISTSHPMEILKYHLLHSFLRGSPTLTCKANAHKPTAGMTHSESHTHAQRSAYNSRRAELKLTGPQESTEAPKLHLSLNDAKIA